MRLNIYRKKMTREKTAVNPPGAKRIHNLVQNKGCSPILYVVCTGGYTKGLIAGSLGYVVGLLLATVL